MSDKITKIIDKMVKEHTFTPATLKYLEKLEVSAKSFEKAYEESRVENKELGIKCVKLTLKNEELTKESTLVSKRRELVKIKEEELNKRDWELKIAEAKVSSSAVENGHRHAMGVLGVIFKNPVYKKSFYRSSTVPVANPSGYVEQHSKSETEEVTKTVQE